MIYDIKVIYKEKQTKNLKTTNLTNNIDILIYEYIYFIRTRLSKYKINWDLGRKS